MNTFSRIPVADTEEDMLLLHQNLVHQEFLKQTIKGTFLAILSSLNWTIIYSGICSAVGFNYVYWFSSGVQMTCLYYSN